jgi:hypothetical protein
MKGQKGVAFASKLARSASRNLGLMPVARLCQKFKMKSMEAKIRILLDISCSKNIPQLVFMARTLRS